MNIPERRRHPRYTVTLRVRGWAYDQRAELHAFTAKTMNIGRDGIAILCYDDEEKIQRLLSLLSQNQPVHVELALPPEGVEIAATGRARWYEAGSITGPLEYLIAGILFDHMLPQAKRQWEQFIDGRGHMTAVEVFS